MNHSSLSVDGRPFPTINDTNEEEVVFERIITIENGLVVRHKLPSTVEACIDRLIIIVHNMHASMRFEIEGYTVN